MTRKRAGLVALFGNLAPRGAILKRSAADERLFEQEGRAVVFTSLADLAAELLVELPFSQALQETPAPRAVPAAATELAEAVTEALDSAGEVDAPADAPDVPPAAHHDVPMR